MLNSYTINLQTEAGEKEIFISPFLLQSKIPPNLKSGNIEKLFFYIELKDDSYKAALEQEELSDRFKTDEFIINVGQDFEKYYLGSFRVDFQEKRCSQWEGKTGILTEQEIKTLGESLFNPSAKSRRITLFTPTRPSDFNFGSF
ncbi:hypothetical protein [Mucilaginibacter rubeus]|uniref:Uncharacterized protein n=1 Tax=Mucilaginibacter rubeus TaxID=2027860 RepID=A0A5C1I5J1_9SPHI|nr:hypothetical protein [Mucilaginibacter rubeus]QEM13173.1 hypothetical protein DEO27_025235 [Mucilaginibacter rubeus]